jgi:hypothetical protein
MGEAGGKMGEVGRIKWDPHTAGPNRSTLGRRLLVAHQRAGGQGRLATNGRPPAAGLSYCRTTVSNFLIFFKFFFGGWVHGTPIFQASPYIWKCQIFHSS